MIKIGILGGAGYTAGELIRLLVNHPETEIKFIHSESNAGNPVTDVHEGLLGDCDMTFTSSMPFDEVDVVFFCFGHGKSEAFLCEHDVPANVRIIDLAQDFRLKPSVKSYEALAKPTPECHDYVYGLPELNREVIRGARHVANPGCFATCIQLALLPLAQLGLLRSDISVNAITGSTGAGQKPQATTHFSWRTGNMSIYKAFQHQHVPEICQSLNQLQAVASTEQPVPVIGTEAGQVHIDFIPYRGDFARGIFATSVVHLPQWAQGASFPSGEGFVAAYKNFYAASPFTHYSDRPIDLKQVVNTNKCLVHVDAFCDKLLVTSCIDNLLKGAVGQAVENMNLMFGLDETTGLRLKANAF
ncbi:MAG: N-acetyl-gamma-glutamyl-phosphate reductase [Prevotella sp.]|nr:N-acetyl-gamma-glutamyl-phosphate reductase [Prevotella sp.]